jgi:Fur family ferric uptake transcriptional regulator
MRKARLRVTEPRKAILHYLIEFHGPFTADEIHTGLTKPICDLVTIYRCLASLEKAGLIRRCDFGDGTARYELAAQNSHHHHHVICKECKKVKVLDDCQLADLNRVARKLGYSNVTHSLEFFGICPDCK